MVKIAGRLEDGLGNAIADCQIELKAQKNSSAVLVRTSAHSVPDGAGNYTMNVKPGIYAVRLLIEGCPPNDIGDIKIFSDSKPGTLNDFLLNPTESEITPALLAQVTDERKQTQQAAINAQNSAAQASTTLTNIVKKTGETTQSVSGTLNATTLQEKGQRVYSPNNKPSATDVGALSLAGGTSTGGLNINAQQQNCYFHLKDSTANTDYTISASSKGTFVHFITGTNGNKTRLLFDSKTNNWNFTQSTVTINNTPVLKQGDYGLGAATGRTTTLTASHTLPCGVYGVTTTDMDENPVSGAHTASLLNLATSNVNWKYQLYTICYGAKPKLFLRSINSGGSLGFVEAITTANSTIDANGFYKKASPIIRLFANEDIESTDEFKKSGCGLINSEATGVTAKRIDIGHYEIHGSLGFAKDGWYITLPEDANGNKKFFANYSTDANNVITIRTFTKKFDMTTCEVVAGKPVDITAKRWIDIRLAMSAKAATVDAKHIEN